MVEKKQKTKKRQLKKNVFLVKLNLNKQILDFYEAEYSNIIFLKDAHP